MPKCGTKVALSWQVSRWTGRGSGASARPPSLKQPKAPDRPWSCNTIDRIVAPVRFRRHRGRAAYADRTLSSDARQSHPGQAKGGHDRSGTAGEDR
jgi:hypothetical protein